MENKTQNSLNEMETMPMTKLAFKISIPMVLSMISIALYGIVDSMFISKISEYTLEVVSLSIPIQSIITAIALGTGIGLNSLLAKTLGEKNHEKSKKIISHGIILMLISWGFIVLGCLLGLKPFFCAFTQNEIIQKLGYTYVSISGILSFGALYQILFEKILEAHGKTKESMVVQMSGAIINLILDPILIFGYLGLPALGIKGAAFSTVIGQCIGMLIGLGLLIKNQIIETKEKVWYPLEKSILWDIYKVGFPTMLLESVTAYVTLALNKILVGINEDAISVWGVYCHLQKFVIIIVYGFNYGMIPIIAYNWGTKNMKRVEEAIRVFLKISVTVTLSGTLVFLLLTKQIITIYDVSKEVLDMATTAFHIMAFGFVFAGISLVFSATFQAFGKGVYSLIVNMSRQLVFPLLLLLVLKNYMGVNCVWVSFTTSEIITVVIALCLRSINKKELLSSNLSSETS